MVEQLLIQSLVDGLILGTIYALAAMGLSLAFGIMHVINVSHGDFVVLGAFIAYILWSLLGVNPLLAVPLTIAINGSIGFLLQRYVVNRIVDAPPLTTLVFFFGLAITLPNLYILLWGPFNRSIVSPYLTTPYIVGEISISLAKLLALIVALISIITTILVINKTKLGLAMRATAQDREAALMFGINIYNIYAAALAFSLILAGISGSLIAMTAAFTPVQGATYTLLTFLIVVLGGMGYIYGSIVGGLLMGLLQVLVATYIGALYVYAIMFLVLYIILLISPRGILRRGI